MIPIRQPWATLLACVLALVIGGQAFGQAREVNAGDQRRNDRVIFNLEKTATSGLVAISRVQEAAGLLLSRLQTRGATVDQIQAVAAHYSRTITATRIRQQARINALANAQERVLNSLSGAETLLSELNGARNELIGDLIQAENDALAAVASALAAAGG
jgi:hypothetical protein